MNHWSAPKIGTHLSPEPKFQNCWICALSLFLSDFVCARFAYSFRKLFIRASIDPTTKGWRSGTRIHVNSSVQRDIYTCAFNTDNAMWSGQAMVNAESVGRPKTAHGKIDGMKTMEKRKIATEKIEAKNVCYLREWVLERFDLRFNHMEIRY